MPNEQLTELPDPARLTWIGEIVRHNLSTRPRATALTYGDEEWNWTEFDARIRHNVTGLRSDRLQRGERIAVLDRNHPACLDALFAAASMGLVCTFIDWRLDAEHIVYALNESEARFLFCGHEFASLHEQISMRLDTVVSTQFFGGPHDEYEGWLETHETSEAMVRSAHEVAAARGDDPVLRIYSSQGVKGPTRSEYSHRRLLRAASERIKQKEIRPEDVDAIDVPLSNLTATVRALATMAAGGVTTLLRED